MATQMQGIGIAIGDDMAVAAGWSAATGNWEVSQPSRVSTPSPADRVELLLAGTEAEAAGMEPLLVAPRRRRYAPGAPDVAAQLLAALLATLRQQVAPVHLQAATHQTVLVLPHTLDAASADVVVLAAALAGWGQVRVISELAALAALQAPASAGVRMEVRVTEEPHVYRGFFVTAAGERGLVLRLEQLEALKAERTASPQMTERMLARGAARLAAGVEIADVVLGEGFPVALGVAATGVPVAVLGSASKPGRLMRAICPPPPDGALLQLVVCTADGQQPLQVVASIPLEPAPGARDDRPWLLIVEVETGCKGLLRVMDGQGGLVVEERFCVRLP